MNKDNDNTKYTWAQNGMIPVVPARKIKPAKYELPMIIKWLDRIILFGIITLLLYVGFYLAGYVDLLATIQYLISIL